MSEFGQNFPVNELGEIVFSVGVGSNNITSYLPVDFLPMSSTTGIPAVSNENSSNVLAFRGNTADTIPLVANVPTALPVGKNLEITPIGCSKISDTVIQINRSGSFLCLFNASLTTSGGGVTRYSAWVEYSTNGGATWQPVPNSLRDQSMPINSSVNASTSFVVNVVAGVQLRAMVLRDSGSTTAQLDTSSVNTGNGTVSQPSASIRIVGV